MYCNCCWRKKMGGKAAGSYQTGKGQKEKQERSSTLQGNGLGILMIKVSLQPFCLLALFQNTFH